MVQNIPLTINGGIGDDVLTGGRGNDTISGGTGDDLLAGGDAASTASQIGANQFDGGPGFDVILVKGAVPGAKGGYILVSDSIKKALPDGVPFPAAVRNGGAAETPADDAATEASEE